MYIPSILLFNSSKRLFVTREIFCSRVSFVGETIRISGLIITLAESWSRGTTGGTGGTTGCLGGTTGGTTGGTGVEGTGAGGAGTT